MERALGTAQAELRRHLAQLKAIYTTAPVGLAFTDLEHRYTSVNERLAALTDRTADDLLGRRVDEAMPGPVGERALAFRRQVLETGQPLFDVELEGVLPAEPERRRTWLGSYFPVYDGEGQPLGVNAVVVEITGRQREKERLEQEVRERTEQARRLATDLTLAEQRERRRIAGILHDDIQQKLYALQVHIHILGGLPALQEQREVQLRTSLIGRLIDELIEDNSKLSVELSPPTISHEGLLDAIGWLRQYIAHEHGLQIHLETAGDLRVEDPDLREVIFQMIRELLLNVAKHAGVREAYLRLRRAGNRLVVRVEDEGAGFDPALLEPPDADAPWGLRTLRERVDVFDGALEVDSQPGRGARITLVMPTEVSGR
jgi:PAS domain S-box-containing protein